MTVTVVIKESFYSFWGPISGSCLGEEFEGKNFDCVDGVQTRVGSNSRELKTKVVKRRSDERNTGESKAPFTLLRIHMKTDTKVSVFALRSHCSAMKTETFENAL